MGCAASKIDQLPAVSLCRDRCNFLEEALQQSYALADAHVAYMHSLKILGPTLHHFFNQGFKSTSDNDSAVSSEKSPNQPSQLSSPDHSISSSNSDSHIQFDTDTDSEEEETGKDFSRSFNQIHSNHLNHGSLTSYSLPAHNYHANTYPNSDFSVSGWKTPPPPAPMSTAWDYLNFFDEIYERYELPYSSTKAVKKKEEARHDLGGGAQRQVEQVHGDEKSSANHIKEKREPSGETVPLKKSDADNKKKEDSEMVKVQKRTDLNDQLKNQSGKQSVPEVMKELQVLFEKASESGTEFLKILDTGKFRYQHKKSVYLGTPILAWHPLLTNCGFNLEFQLHSFYCFYGAGSSKMFQKITSNSSETESLLYKENVSSVDSDEIVSSQNLSSTLSKLCMWEKKLYDEVKV